MRVPEVLVGVLLLFALTRSSAPPAALTWGYVDGQPVQLHLVDVGDGQQLRVDVAAAWLEMVDAAARAGVELILNSAFRTMAEQQMLRQLYESGVGPIAAVPGYSHHQAGTALDILTKGGAFEWLTAHARDFRFYRTVPSEPWHWEYL